MDKTNQPDVANTARIVSRPETKDHGRVTIGGGAMHFGDAGRDTRATKDSGRVTIGGGALRF